MPYQQHRIISAYCETDGCNVQIFELQTERTANEHLEKRGWHTYGGRTFCPTCKDRDRIPEKYR